MGSPQEVEIHGYKNDYSNSGYFPREIMVVGRRIQQIVTCYDVFSPNEYVEVGQVFNVKYDNKALTAVCSFAEIRPLEKVILLC